MEDIKANPHLHVVCKSDESGVDIIQLEKNQIFTTEHFDYDAWTLVYKHERDLGAGGTRTSSSTTSRTITPARTQSSSGGVHSILFFTNGLNYCVYQRTPYNINDIGRWRRGPASASPSGVDHRLTTLGLTNLPTMASLTNGLSPETSPPSSMTAWISLVMWVKTSLKILQESPPVFSIPHSW